MVDDYRPTEPVNVYEAVDPPPEHIWKDQAAEPVRPERTWKDNPLLWIVVVVLVFMALAGKSLVFVFFVAILGFFLYAIRPVMQAWLLESTPRNMGGTSIGVLFGAQAAGSSIGPLLGGIVADQYGLTATFNFLAVTIIIANLFIFFMPRTEAKPA